MRPILRAVFMSKYNGKRLGAKIDKGAALPHPPQENAAEDDEAQKRGKEIV
jgi:hypothetical protein